MIPNNLLIFNWLVHLFMIIGIITVTVQNSPHSSVEKGFGQTEF